MAITEQASSPTRKKFVKTGAIDPFFSKWLFENVRHQGKQYTRPVLDIENEVITDLRREQYKKEKLIFAKVASYLEVFPDLKGEFASVDTNFFYDASDDLRFYAALLNSEPVQFLYTAMFGALRMRGGDFQFQAPQLRLVPIPRKPQEVPSSENDQVNDLILLLDGGRYDEFLEMTAKCFESLEEEAMEYATAKRLLCELTNYFLDIFKDIGRIEASFNPFRAIPRSTPCRKLLSVFANELRLCVELNEDKILQTHHDIEGFRLHRHGGRWRLSVLVKLRLKENGEWRSTWVKENGQIRREWKGVFEIEADEDKGLYYTLVFDNLREYKDVFIPGGKTRSVQQKINEAKIPDFIFNEHVQQMIELRKTRAILYERADRLKECLDSVSYYTYGMNRSEVVQARKILKKLEEVYSQT